MGAFTENLYILSNLIEAESNIMKCRLYIVNGLIMQLLGVVVDDWFSGSWRVGVCAIIKLCV